MRLQLRQNFNCVIFIDKIGYCHVTISYNGNLNLHFCVVTLREHAILNMLCKIRKMKYPNTDLALNVLMNQSKEI